MVLWHALASLHLSLGGEVGLRSNPGEGAFWEAWSIARDGRVARVAYGSRLVFASHLTMRSCNRRPPRPEVQAERASKDGPRAPAGSRETLPVDCA